MSVQIRWLIRRDMDQIHRIEAEAFEVPWTEDDFLKSLRQRHIIGMVAENQRGDIVGFMIYALQKDRLHIMNFAVDPSSWRRGIGRQMVEKLKAKLSQQRRTVLELVIGERNLRGQLFWRAMGFEAEFVRHTPWEESDEDAYVMRFHHRDMESVWQCEDRQIAMG